MVSNVEPFVVKNNEQNTMNNEQENLLQFISGMARSAQTISTLKKLRIVIGASRLCGP